MPVFKPFRGIRPVTEILEIFPTPNVEQFSETERLRRATVDSSYMQMVKPYICSKAKDVDRNLRKVRTNFEEMVQTKKLVQDDTCYYLYAQIKDNKTVFRGLLGLTSVDDFLNGKIKKHESTLTEKKERLAQALEKVHVQAEPVLLTYPANPKIELLMNHEEKSVPVINFVCENGTRHKIWRIENRLKLAQFKEVLDQVDSFYIADGHHRIGSVALNARNRREKLKKHTGLEPYNYIFSFIVSNQSIKIHDYNRLIRDLNGLTEQQFLDRLGEYFLIHEKGETPYYPSQKFHISLYMGGKFYSLHVKHDLRSKADALENLDYHLLEKLILKPVLGIDNVKLSKKLSYIRGTSTIDGIMAMKDQVDSGDFVAGFGLYPVSFNDFVQISDLQLKMPPKSTYIEPKLLTALVMYDMKH